jgi:hypothetical protein
MSNEEMINVICNVTFISAVSQCLIEDIEDGVYNKEFKFEAAKTGKAFIKTLDKKLNLMLPADDEAAQLQLLETASGIKEQLTALLEEIKGDIRNNVTINIDKVRSRIEEKKS